MVKNESWKIQHIISTIKKKSKKKKLKLKGEKDNKKEKG